MVYSECLSRLVLRVLCCPMCLLCTDHFVMVPLNVTYLHCLHIFSLNIVFIHVIKKNLCYKEKPFQMSCLFPDFSLSFHYNTKKKFVLHKLTITLNLMYVVSVVWQLGKQNQQIIMNNICSIVLLQLVSILCCLVAILMPQNDNC